MAFHGGTKGRYDICGYIFRLFLCPFAAVWPFKNCLYAIYADYCAPAAAAAAVAHHCVLRLL